jgi:hypothetical protein
MIHLIMTCMDFWRCSRALLSYFQKESHASSEEDRHGEAQRHEALQGMYTALVATKRYQEFNDGAQDRDKERELSQLWATPAIKPRKYFKESAARKLRQGSLLA